MSNDCTQMSHFDRSQTDFSLSLFICDEFNGAWYNRRKTNWHSDDKLVNEIWKNWNYFSFNIGDELNSKKTSHEMDLYEFDIDRTWEITRECKHATSHIYTSTNTNLLFGYSHAELNVKVSTQYLLSFWYSYFHPLNILNISWTQARRSSKNTFN